MNPFIALALGAVMGGVLASGGEPKKNLPREGGDVVDPGGKYDRLD